MAFLPKSLEYLCVEIIGKNIDSISKKPYKKLYLKHRGDLGTKLIYSLISNCFYMRLDENCFQFIFDHFHVKELKINDKLCSIINNFKFLNGIHIKYLEINTGRFSIDCNEINNLNLTVDELKIDLFEGKMWVLEFLNNFSKLIINKKFIIQSLSHQLTACDKLENEIIHVLLMSSDNIESVEINSIFFSQHFKIKLREILKKKHIKYIQILDIVQFFTSLLNSPELIILTNITQFELSINNDFDFEDGIEIFKSLQSIENLEIDCYAYKTDTVIDTDIGQIEKFFSMLKIFNSKKIRYLKLVLFKQNFYNKQICSFLQNCKSLESLSLSNGYDARNDFSFMNSSLQYSFKRLVQFQLRYFKLQTMQCIDFIDNIFSNSKINELHIQCANFNEEIFQKFLLILEKLKFSLRDLKFDQCSFSINDRLHLSKSLNVFQGLEKFSLMQNILNGQDQLILCKGLQNSYKTLKHIHIWGFGELKVQSYPRELFEFLQKSEALNSIELNVEIPKYLLNEYISNLKKFCSNLKTFHINYTNYENSAKPLCIYLSMCPELEYFDCFGSFFRDGIENPKSFLKCLENSKYTLKRLPFNLISSKEEFLKFPKIEHF